jgi:uncharacterized protein (TIGR02145 family)
MKTTIIAKLEWMTENLNVDTFRNGESIPEAQTAEEWRAAGEEKRPAWCIYENNVENGAKFGKLYNWYAVNDPRGLAPEGWHVFGEEEWKTVVDELGISGLGAKLKTIDHWDPPNAGAADVCGFSALPGGYRSKHGEFIGMGKNGSLWSATEFNALYAWCRIIYSWNTDVNRLRNMEKGNGCYVRCVRD